MTDLIASPSFATAAGLLLYGRQKQAAEVPRAGPMGWFAGRLWGYFKEFF
jgi:hypothetical protein